VAWVLGVLLRGVAFLAGRLPFRLLRVPGAVLGWLAGRVLRIRRSHVLGAMRTAGMADPDAAADGMYRALGVSVFELLWLAGRKIDAAALARVSTLDPVSDATLRSLEAGGRGLVLVGAHTGNWELAACALATRAELLVVAKRLSVGPFDAFARRTRAAYGVSLADPEGALAVAQETLARGGWVTMLQDQVPALASHGTAVSFLGQGALADRAPAALAWRTGAPLVVVASRRGSSGVQHLEVLATLEPPDGAGRAWIDEATRQATLALERFVFAHPSQWLWLHRRWRRPLPARAASACLPADSPLNEARHA